VRASFVRAPLAFTLIALERSPYSAVGGATMTTAGEVGSNAGLTMEQLGVLRSRLERVRGELRVRLARDEAMAREAQQEIEALDAAEQTREQDDAVARAEYDRTQLREVEDAVRRFETGRYGVSEISGDPISYERLLVVPWARYDSDEDPSG